MKLQLSHLLHFSSIGTVALSPMLHNIKKQQQTNKTKQKQKKNKKKFVKQKKTKQQKHKICSNFIFFILNIPY